MLQVGGISLSFPNTLSNFFLFVHSSFLLAHVLPATLQTATPKFLTISIRLCRARSSWWMKTLCGISSAINLNAARQLDASKLRWSQVFCCSLPTAYPEVTLEFAPSFNLPQRRLCCCRDPWRSQWCFSCQLFLWVQGQPLLTLGLSVTCHVLSSIWIQGYQASWELSQALAGYFVHWSLAHGNEVIVCFPGEFWLSRSDGHSGWESRFEFQHSSSRSCHLVSLNCRNFSPGLILSSERWGHGLQQIPKRSCEQQRQQRGSCKQSKT